MTNSTPNYGYNSDLPAIHGIDADLRRVEDKADANGQLAIQVARNDERITGIDKRVDKLECGPCNTYCKEAIDCKLDSKASKCEFEKHLTDCDAHKKLFNQKVDKKDGCRLICEEELQQIRDDIEDRYTKDDTDNLLANKMNITRPIIFDLPLCDGIENTIKESHYYITQEGIVNIHLDVRKKDSSIFVSKEVIAQLPEGYRPYTWITFPFMGCKSTGQQVNVGHMHINSDGEIYIGSYSPQDDFYWLISDCSFVSIS